MPPGCINLMVQPWNLWLDDQLDDPETPTRHTPEGFLGAKSSLEALELVRQYGPPAFMDLDHDLGLTPEGPPDDAMVFLRALEELHSLQRPAYRVHSRNPVGAQRIKSFMDSWGDFLCKVEEAADNDW